MNNISIEKFSNFLSWAYKNGYIYGENMYSSGWLTRTEIISVRDYDQRNELRRSTEKLFQEFCNSK